MLDPNVTHSQIFGNGLVDMPEVWESNNDKPITVKLLNQIAVDNAHLLRAFIANNYNRVENEYRLQGFIRDEYTFFMEAAQLDSNVMMAIPAKTLSHRTTAGWMVMAGEVPGLLVFDIHYLIDYQRKMFGMYPEPDSDKLSEEEYNKQVKALEPPQFLFGEFIAFPENLRGLIDPENKYFKNYVAANPDLPELVINFAQFIHEKLPDEEEE